MSDRLADLAKRKEEAFAPGTDRARERQHNRGKLLARERIDALLDPGSFHELDLLARRPTESGFDDRPYTDGVICGWGTVDGRKVFVFSQDFTVFGGALGEVFADKIHKLMDLALKVGAPVVGINDGAGARIQEGVVSLDSYGGIFYRNVQSSGVVPQISVIMGPCAGGAVYSPAMTDFVFMVEDTSYMFITGPDVVKTVTGETVTQQELGGAIAHASKSGVCHFTSADDAACLDDVRYLLGFLPANNLEEPPVVATEDDPEPAVPRAAGHHPGVVEPALRHARRHRGGGRRRRLLRVRPPVGAEHRVRLRPARRPRGGHHRQPADAPGRRPRHRVVGEGGPLRAHLRRLQHPAGVLRRRARLPARRRPGARRHHPPRRQAALRLLRVDGAPHPGRHPQGLRRRVRGHELQVDRRRPGLRLAVGRAGGDGPAGRGRDRLPAGDHGGDRPGRPAGPSWSRSTPTGSPTRTRPPSAATSTT